MSRSPQSGKGRHRNKPRDPGAVSEAVERRRLKGTIDPDLVSEAVRRGYLEFNDDRTRVTYACARRFTDDYTDPEEPVRAALYSWLILDRGYSAKAIEVEVSVPRRTPADRADIVVYRERHPFLVAETKQPYTAQTEWERGIKQGFGNAANLKGEYLLVDRGEESALYDVGHCPDVRERDSYRLGDRTSVPVNYGLARRLRLVAGGTDDVQPADPRTIETRVRRAHAAIWAGGKRDPLTAFDEWSKILFAKVWDERHTPNGEPRSLQVGANESAPQSAARVLDRFREARRRDPSIFTDDAIRLPDDKIAEVVGTVQDIGFTLCDIESLGAAFEHFFSEVFRGGLGQYFTRREICRFVCAVLGPTERDVLLDPTVGSGGFLLEALLQVWHRVDDLYAGQIEADRLKTDFALHNLFGIEIHEVLGRVCKTNLLIHKDGHVNIEAERSCLDRIFANPALRPDGSRFTILLGNPPFGDEVKEGDRDRLGDGSLADFEVTKGRDQISSELVIIERALQFLIPGGRLGMVVPDGALNNSGEGSACPAFRRLLFRHSVVTAVVSLPDYAFRKAGAQNKTSLLFLRKYTAREKARFDAAYVRALRNAKAEEDPTPEQEDVAIRAGLQELTYRVFLAEVHHVGYTPAGVPTTQNELCSITDHRRICADDLATVLGQWYLYSRDPLTYSPCLSPRCHAVSVVDVFDAHSSRRLDPKYHLFQLERIEAPDGMREYRLGDVLRRRQEEVKPGEHPDEEFVTLKLSQTGALSRREAGKGKNPPAWYGAYFTSGSRWYRVHYGDVLISQIDLWKGCIAVVPEQFGGAVVTQEFPVYSADHEAVEPRYLALLLRSRYFRRATRAITTGHSNRRRTQPEDFENLRVFLPERERQWEIVSEVESARARLGEADQTFQRVLESAEMKMFGNAPLPAEDEPVDEPDDEKDEVESDGG
jgi:type I restriction enzyme M protein